MVRKLLGLFDILVGLVLIVKPEFSFIRIMGYISLGKGVWSLFSSVAMGYFFDWMGILDTISGIGLFLIIRGSISPLLSILGVVMMIKGIYSMV